MNLIFERLLLFSSLFVIPFSYSSIFGIRLISLKIALVGLCLLKNLRSFDFILRSDVVFLIALFLYCYLFTVGELSYLKSLITFFLIVYWPRFVHPFNIAFYPVLKFYLYGVIFSSVGIYLQSILLHGWGIEIGNVARFADNRIALGFIWDDYSFLSLYLSSATPLFFNLYGKRHALVLGAGVFIASVLTSARTGPYSLIVISLLYFSFRLCSSKNFAQIKSTLMSSAYTFIFFGIVLKVCEYSGTRNVTISDSGRSVEYQSFFSIYSRHIKELFFGAGFSLDQYIYMAGIRPHHFVLDIVAMGGVCFFVLVLVWIYLFSKKLSVRNVYCLTSVAICGVGFNFLPSLFSGYFLAFLLSLMILYDQNKKECY